MRSCSPYLCQKWGGSDSELSPPSELTSCSTCFSMILEHLLGMVRLCHLTLASDWGQIPALPLVSLRPVLSLPLPQFTHQCNGSDSCVILRMNCLAQTVPAMEGLILTVPQNISFLMSPRKGPPGTGRASFLHSVSAAPGSASEICSLKYKVRWNILEPISSHASLEQNRLESVYV